MSIIGKINTGMTKVKEEMRNSADCYKIEGQISEQEKKIKKLSKEIGTLVIVRLEAGDEMAPEIMERYQAIKEAEAAIAELRQGREEIEIACPECEARVFEGMNYCGQCGAKIISE